MSTSMTNIWRAKRRSRWSKALMHQNLLLSRMYLLKACLEQGKLSVQTFFVTLYATYMAWIPTRHQPLLDALLSSSMGKPISVSIQFQQGKSFGVNHAIPLIPIPCKTLL